MIRGYFPTFIPRCQHLKVNGKQCGSPALRHERYCYFHDRWRQERSRKGEEEAPPSGAFELPVLEDANAIQVAVMRVMQMMINGQLTPKMGGMLLYGLQIASNNLHKIDLDPMPDEVVIDPENAGNVPLGENAWDAAEVDPEDFEDEEERELAHSGAS
jgi:hypothetical protein